MSLKFYHLKVSEKYFLNSSAVRITLDVSDELKNIFSYKPGQFLSFKININGTDYRREYSISSSPFCDINLEIASKNVKNGIVSNYLFDSVKEGDTILSYPPQGSFYTELDPSNKKRYVMIAGGSGITPVFSIIKSVLHTEPESEVVLYFGNDTEESIMFRKELDLLHSQFKERFRLLYTLKDFNNEWKGFKGIVNTEELEKILSGTYDPGLSETEYFICGPAEMMKLIKDFLNNKKVPHNKIHIEYFSAPVSPEKSEKEDKGGAQYEKKNIRVILNGDEHEVNVPENSVILDAVINADLDPPFSCRSGICSTCRAKLYSGKVKMDEREGLSDSEIDDGYILTCQSHPLTDDVKLEYM
ncbi:MAG: 2Fe-2S iron-sulfur cluster binding domain-containing protein [Bacteroidetes bacterium]|nr:2Fe-2S iron-sulfur cluster binding domain-containing protein [Bacteroidota bacterium]